MVFEVRVKIKGEKTVRVEAEDASSALDKVDNLRVSPLGASIETFADFADEDKYGVVKKRKPTRIVIRNLSRGYKDFRYVLVKATDKCSERVVEYWYEGADNCYAKLVEISERLMATGAFASTQIFESAFVASAFDEIGLGDAEYNDGGTL